MLKQFNISVLIGLIFLVSCTANRSSDAVNEELKVIQGNAQGTTYTIKYFAKKKIDKSGVDALLDKIDASMSTWNEKSIITQFNNSDTAVRIDDYFLRNLLMSYGMYRVTEGAFNPLVKPLMNYWSFESEDKRPETVDTVEVNRLVELCQMDSLVFLIEGKEVTLEEYSFRSTLPKDVFLKKKLSGMQLDFNAIAQGFSVDLLGAYLDEHDVHDYLIELGGEMLAKGRKNDGTNWVTGIDKPVVSTVRELEASIELDNQAIATSGNYRKFYEREGIKYHHTLDPKTGMPARHTLLSATVIAQDCAGADAIATSLMVMGIEQGKDYLGKYKGKVDAFLIYSDEKGEYQYYTTTGLEKKIKHFD